MLSRFLRAVKRHSPDDAWSFKGICLVGPGLAASRSRVCPVFQGAILKSRFTSINSKLVLLISAILLGTIAAILTSVDSILFRFQRKEVERALERTEWVVDTLIVSELSRLKVQAALVGELPILSTVVENGNPNTIRDVGSTYQAALKVPILGIFGRDGKRIASVGKDSLAQDSLIDAFCLQVLSHGSQAAVFSQKGKLLLLTAALIGTGEDASGILLLGFPLDSGFAATIRDFTKSEIVFLAGERNSGSSVRLEELRLKRPLLAGHNLAAGDRKSDAYREDGNYAIRDLALKGVHGDGQGHIVILMPLTEYHRIFSELKTTLLAIACLVFVIACFISYRFSSSFTRPIAKAVRFAKNLAAGDRNSPIEINRSDELGTLQESLEIMRVALRELFEHMDARIQEGVRNVTNILDNLESGFLIFDRDGIIQPGYSRISEQYFGAGLSGKRLGDVLALDAGERDTLEMWLEVLFDGTLSFKNAAALGPDSFHKKAKCQIKLSYRPIRVGEVLQGVILIATDKTRENELAHRFEQERERAKMILRIASNRDAFQEFIADSGNLIADLDERLSQGNIDLDAISRTIHTLKGNSTTFHCLELSELAHDFESGLAGVGGKASAIAGEIRSALLEKIEGLRAALARLIDQTRALLGEEIDSKTERKRIAVPIAVLDELDKAILDRFRADSRIFRLFHDTFVLDSFLPALQKYEPMLIELALRRGKMLYPIEWTGEDIRVRMRTCKRLASALVHAFRNVVDHGIEEPEEREAAGKDPRGRIQVAITMVAGSTPRLRIRIADDGSGIDPEAVRSKLIADGKASEAEAGAMDDNTLFQSLFMAGFSTRTAVTETSGRGVGLDAIAHEAERLNGKAWIEAQRGSGTTLFVEVPFLD